MRRQIRGLTKAAENAQDGISMVQIGEGALNEVHDMLQRANELAIKAATGTLQDADRVMIDAEIQQLKAEIDRTARNTTFNEIEVCVGLCPFCEGETAQLCREEQGVLEWSRKTSCPICKSSALLTEDGGYWD